MKVMKMLCEFRSMIAALLISLAKDVVLSGHMTDHVNLAFHLCFIALSIKRSP